MVQTRPTFALTTALLAALSLGGCASLCGAPGGPPQPPPPPPSAAELAAMQACAQEQGARLPSPPGAGRQDDRADRPLDRAAFGRCLTSKGVVLPPHPPGGPGRDRPGNRDEPGEPHGPPPPHDPEFDAALQACATAQDIALPLPDAPPPGPPPASLLQCLEAEGFEPPPRHG
ncbi:hypothetical protein [Xanthomonas hortorum]|uniref:hypothetical protein n=1 Tax=Xanthomonas hortorum TaxID=56454 RepID=UPI0015D60421|nr:hypothetical protein [Xanthomonas hortorum]MCE4359191.1 hypothetical protein [Xanthomonas hortorum pv. taraxaci]NMI51889.1 hypothetical protein [Xanthomonas hortorum pv. taraxaci]